MHSLLNAMSVSLKEHKQEVEEEKALKARIDLVLESIKKQWLSGQIILDDLILILAVSRAEKAGFSYSREYHTAQERDKNIIPRIKKAVIENQIPIYNEQMDCRENEYVLQQNHLPKKAIVKREDFLKWQQETMLVAIPPVLKELENYDTPKPQQSKNKKKTSEPRIAYKRAIVDNWQKIREAHGENATARQIMAWLKEHDRSGDIDNKQGAPDTLRWRSEKGVWQNVSLCSTFNNAVSNLRTNGFLPPK